MVGAYIKSHTLSMPFEALNMTLVPPVFIQKLLGLRTFSNQFFWNSIQLRVKIPHSNLH